MVSTTWRRRFARIRSRTSDASIRNKHSTRPNPHLSHAAFLAIIVL